MKAITQEFKDTIKLFGRELDSIITYEDNGDTIELGNEQLNSVSPHYEGGILKSVMKVLDIDSNEDIPLETVINFQFGVKVRNDEVEDYRDNYDYIDFGNYVVYKSEKQEDSNSYKITCYDKMLYSMKDYEALNITYPITIRNYINTIATYMGITFANINETFANYDKQIPNELYLDSEGNSLGYTFRDVLDELAEVTASTICINDNDEFEIRYINITNDSINEEYLKDINVNFGESYGPINTIVLSRSAGSDNIYFPSTLPENPVEIKITDNQIMNGNNRDSYLPDIYNKLNGLTYYLNDYSSTGICYYDLCDRYNIIIGDNTYSCIMFNDDIQITQGLEEHIHTDLPEESVTDYTKADSTDRKINQTYLIVDKQNNAIEGMSSQITDQNEQIASIRLQYNELISRISDIADITTSAEDTDASVSLENINASQPISIKIHPIIENISYLYPHNSLYPSSTLYPKSAILKFTNTTTNEVFDWYLPTSLWYYDSTIYDELELSYGDGTNSTVIVTRKCQIDNNGTISALATSTTETYAYPSDILLTDGDYTVSLIGNTMGYLYVQLMAKNIYTTQFYTKAETNSIISQTASNINLSVDQKLSNYSTTTEMNSAISISAGEINQTVSQKVGNNEIISKINQTPETITINASKLNLQGYITASDLSGSGTTTINGSNITTGTINGNSVNVTNISGSNITGGTINGNNVNITNLNASNITSGTISGSKINGGTISGTTINVSTNLTVGNKIIVGSNQSNTSSTNKYINLTDDAYLRRYRSGSANYLALHCDQSTTIDAGNYYLALHYGGTILTNATSTPWSDKRLKNSITDINVDWINDLKIKEFEYNHEKDKKQIGLIAQDYIDKDYNKYFIYKAINPQDDKEYYTINYQNILNALIKYCQELNNKIDKLTQRIEKLERESDK